jgi:hypothetical protein
MDVENLAKRGQLRDFAYQSIFTDAECLTNAGTQRNP